MLSSTWIALGMPLNCACSLAVLTTTEISGQVASDCQLGAYIVQEGQPVAYFPHKLSKSQQNYMFMEKKMFSLVATLTKFQGMLLGSDTHVFIDHKNFTFDI
ncbi:hypothetical protein ACHAW6_006888 [Cyclotella cf. meneghiniana]